MVRSKPEGNRVKLVDTVEKQWSTPALLGISAIDGKGMKWYIVCMPGLSANIRFTGSVDGLCFYKMYGSCFVRTKSSLTGKRFWKDKAFEGSRKSCNQLAKASALTSLFYRNYPKEKRGKGLFNEMTGKVKLWLKEGKTEEEARLLLKKNYPVPQQQIKEKQGRVKAPPKPPVVKKKEKLFTVLTDASSIACKRKHKPKRLYCIKE
jgi:hypothetical protein